MAQMFEAGDNRFGAEDMLALLGRYQLMPQFLRGLIIDKAIAGIECTDEEKGAAIGQLEAQYQLTSPEAKAAWLKSQNLTPEDLEEIATRPLKLERYKQETWGHKVESYFLARKPSLDQVRYSLIRTKDLGLANELYFRIQGGEQSFAEIAKQYSQGVEANTGGLLGPVPIRQPHPLISQLLSVSKPGQLWPPRALAEWFVIVRLEQLIPAQLDDAMRRRLIDEMFETWLNEQIKQMGPLQLVETEPESAVTG